MIRLNLFGDHRPSSFRANRIEQSCGLIGYCPAAHGPAVLGTPDHTVGRLVETVAVGDDLDHASHGILDIYTGQPRSKNAIPPVTEVAGFLAENL